jgi:signal transduction histidine kinase/CheY-like chemotaxis protein
MQLRRTLRVQSDCRGGSADCSGGSADTIPHTLDTLEIQAQTSPETWQVYQDMLEAWQHYNDNDNASDFDSDTRDETAAFPHSVDAASMLARNMLAHNAGTSTLGFVSLLETSHHYNSTSQAPAQVPAVPAVPPVSPLLHTGCFSVPVPEPASVSAEVVQRPRVIASLVRENLPQLSERYIRDNRNICLHSMDSQFLYKLPVLGECVVISNDFARDARRGIGVTQPEGHVQIKRIIIVPVLMNALPVGTVVYANASEDYTVETARQIIETTYTLWPCVVMQLMSGHYAYQLEVEKRFSHQQIELVKEVTAAKDAFLATLSHELRTPLNGIVVMTRMLRDHRQELSPKLQGFVDIMSQCSVQMLEWINDALDYSKMASSRLQLNLSNASLEQIIDESITVGTSQAQSKGLTLRKEMIGRALPKLVRADARRVKQILINLLSNAIKFTDEGTILVTISARTVVDDPNLWCVSIRVMDNGCGINLEDRERIFEVFSHATRDVSEETVNRQGTGLGLAIARKLARLMGGDIRVEANPTTSGCTFIVELVLKEELDLVALLEIYRERLSGRRVMIVDDKEDNRIYLMNLAFQWGLLPTICSSATEALMFVESQARSTESASAPAPAPAVKKSLFDVYWIDIHMPNLNGVELAQRLRQLFGLGVPIIGLSSIGLEVHGKQVFDVFETKPVDNYSLLSHTTRLVFRQALPLPTNVPLPTTTSSASASSSLSAFPPIVKQPRSPAQKSTQHSPESKRPRRHSVTGSGTFSAGGSVLSMAEAAFATKSQPVLKAKRMSPRSRCDQEIGKTLATKPFVVYAVEDDACNRAILRTLLEQVKHGCENIDLELFETGEQIVARSVERMPHACLIDLRLPGMNGFDVVKAIRNQCQRTNQILPSMIAVTASVLDSDRSQCSVAGFDYHVGKPIDCDYFWSIITTISQRR